MKIRNRIIATTTTIGILSLALVAVAAFPAKKIIETTAEEIVSQRTEIENAYRNRGQIKEASDAFRETTRNAAGLNDLAIHEGHELDFVNELEAAALAHNLAQEISLDTANQTAVSDWEREIPLRIRVRGTYDDVIRYLSDVERLPESVAVSRADIRADSTSLPKNPNGTVSATFDGTVYWIGKNAPAFASRPAEPSR